ncbi:hypothetical protein C7212DRAFT_348949 [Tuber magnatum]|uniref:Uncharacterized protein n=1 Tax=Tuber magnatum TaxID=42249 RepID=A0A317SBB0_9PEZI|nr:hypothetical protein C7212DRAFT_348949 [Tuber magnatum]
MDAVALEGTLAETGAENGRFEGLIAASGMGKERKTMEYTTVDFNRIMRVAIIGVFGTAQAAASEMLLQGHRSPVSQNLAPEWGPHSVCINSISPGYMSTQATLRDFQASPRKEGFLSDGNMLRRRSQWEEYRGTQALLVSNASSFKAGAILLQRMNHFHAVLVSSSFSQLHDHTLHDPVLMFMLLGSRQVAEMSSGRGLRYELRMPDSLIPSYDTTLTSP